MATKKTGEIDKGTRTAWVQETSAQAQHHAKIGCMIKAIDGVAKWTLGEFLHHLFKLVNDDGTDVRRSPKHAAMMSQFLQGRKLS